MKLQVLLAGCLCLAACQPADEGALLGRFHVVATRASSTCGPQSMNFLPRFEYGVELRVRDGAVRWVPQGATTVTGVWDASARVFRVLLEGDTVAWQPDVRRQIAGCTLRRTDVIEGSVVLDDPDAGPSQDAGVDAGSQSLARSFSGSETVVFGAVSGGDCNPLLGASEGQFSALPCEVRYTLEATRP